MLAKFVLRRTLASIPVVIGVSVITFLLMRSTAGSYVPGLALNPTLTPAAVALLRTQLGLDQPLWIQYLDWTGMAWLLQQAHLGGLLVGAHDVTTGILEGNLGHSMVDGTAVSSQVFDRLPNTILLTVTAILLGVVLSIPLGVTGALRRGSKLDQLLTVVSVGGVAVPQFWLGLLLILLFSVKLHDWGLPFLPSSGIVTAFTGGDVLDRVAHLLMPATVLAFAYLEAPKALRVSSEKKGVPEGGPPPLASHIWISSVRAEVTWASVAVRSTKLSTWARISSAWEPSALTQATPSSASCQWSRSPTSATATWNCRRRRLTRPATTCRRALREPVAGR